MQLRAAGVRRGPRALASPRPQVQPCCDARAGAFDASPGRPQSKEQTRRVLDRDSRRTDRHHGPRIANSEYRGRRHASGGREDDRAGQPLRRRLHQQFTFDKDELPRSTGKGLAAGKLALLRGGCRFHGPSVGFNGILIQLNLFSMSKPPAAGLPTLRQLELFLALPDAASIAAAGARVGMSASATSHALRALEEALGCDLVERLGGTGVVLTHAGELALPHARDVFASLQQVKAVAGAARGLRTGRLRIGSIGASTSLRLLPPLLEKFRRRYPGVEVQVTERADAEIEQDLIGRRVDIGVVRLPQPTLHTLAFTTDELVAIVPERHPLARGKTVAVRDLAEYPLVLTQAGSQDMVMRMFERAGVRPKVAHELSQVLSIFEFVARGNGVSVLASSIEPEQHPGLAFRPITPRVARRMAFACLDEKRLSPAARAFWEMARKERPS